VAIDFGLIYEICRPEPFEGWASEYETYWQAIEQIELADKVGFKYAWAVEHHFLEGYSLSSAPEVFLSSVAQRTKKIRIGNGVRLLPPPFNHPARSAEVGAVLDIMSKGRYEFGVGRSITEAELGGFNIDPKDSRPMLDEALFEIVKMWTQNPYPGFNGKYFSMPKRPVLPKPIQDPHPPIWMACTQPSSFELAANYGIGVLAFGVGAPGDIINSVKKYKSLVQNPANPVSQAVNDKVAPATIMYCTKDKNEAIEMGMAAALWYAAQTAKLFAPWAGKEIKGYEYYSNLVKDPEFLKQLSVPLEDRFKDEYSLVGHPSKLIEGVKAYEEIGVDQIICLVQAGKIPHEKIMQSIKLFGEEVISRL
jgi:alkanesulfonate monooxygenase SsuD/methylene tetrahydromethanopterin reductase-like flavin-dependent oxidoreductase (luciferase family)